MRMTITGKKGLYNEGCDFPSSKITNGKSC